MTDAVRNLLLRDGGLAVIAATAIGYWLYTGHLAHWVPATSRKSNPILYWLSVAVVSLAALNGVLVVAEIWLLAS